MSEAVDVYRVAGGHFHDFDFARLELLKLLAEHPAARVAVGNDYADVEANLGSRFLVTYTCNVVPDEKQQEALIRFVERGGRFPMLRFS